MSNLPKKTKEQLDAEVPEGGKRLEKDTNVMALKEGYYDTIRERGDVFVARAGTIMEPGCWFKEVAKTVATTEESDAIGEMTIPDIKVALSEKGIDFTGVTKKADLAAMLAKANAEDNDLA